MKQSIESLKRAMKACAMLAREADDDGLMERADRFRESVADYARAITILETISATVAE